VYLREKGYVFEERNISSDTAARQELMRRGIRGVPTFLIGDDTVVGLDTDKIESLIDYNVVNCPNCPTRLRVPKGKGKLTVTCPKCNTEFRMNT
jgi:glutaredoxin 3